jgi:hypothetical protein
MIAATASANVESPSDAAPSTAPVSGICGFPSETVGVFWSDTAHFP